jgi:hypothetical protein
MQFEPLAERIRAVAAHGAWVEKMVYLAAVTATRKGEERARIMSSLERIEASLADPKAAGAAEQAAELRQAAAELSFFASTTLAEADGSEAEAKTARLAFCAPILSASRIGMSQHKELLRCTL